VEAAARRPACARSSAMARLPARRVALACEPDGGLASPTRQPARTLAQRRRGSQTAVNDCKGSSGYSTRLVVLELSGARRHTSWPADSTALARLAAVQQPRSPAMAQQPACPVAAATTRLHCPNAAGARGRRGGNEWVTRGPHMSLRCRPASYVAVNASIAWSKPLNVGQNNLAPAPGAKSERF